MKKATSISEVFVVLCLCGWKPKFNRKIDKIINQPKYIVNRPPAQKRIVRNFKSMYEIADMLDFTDLMQFRLISKSFNWVATRRPLLKKFRQVRENMLKLPWQEFEPKSL